MKAAYSPPAGLRTSLDDFKDYINEKYHLSINTYHDLHAFSVERINDFWMSVWDFTGVKASRRPTKIVDESLRIDQFPRFFEGARLNFAENLLSRDDDCVAVISSSERHAEIPEQLTWRHLRRVVARYSGALRSHGIRKGEVVAVVGSNCTRSLALFLATASIGAIFSSFATDVGEKALTDRLSQINPRIVFAESSYEYNGKAHDISSKITTSAAALGGIPKCLLVVIGPSDRIDFPCATFEKFLDSADSLELRFEQVSFDTPLVIMFSSGTTGLPKGIVHSHGGLVVNGMKEHRLHINSGPEDVHFHFSGIGWTLWNISIGAMLCGSTLVLYDGSPFYPSPEKFLENIFATGITAFGAGPRYFSELQKLDLKPKRYATRLHSLLSTGAVLSPPLARWLVEAFGPVCQISFSGGTELAGSFMNGTRSLPSYPGEIAVKELGLDIAAYSVDGKSVPDGETGELVCRKPFPNMPVMFWNDPGRKRYHKAYFEDFPHVWTHGDLIRINPITKGIYVLGRSDGTLNPSGVRFGSSEIYNILAAPQFRGSILDALAVGQQRTVAPFSDVTERFLLFIKCSPAQTTTSLLPNSKLRDRMVSQIIKDLSRRHIPAHIFEIPQVPYNANGKKMEIQVKAVLNGGGQALAKLNILPQEMAMLRPFEQFFELERLLERLKKNLSRL